MASGGISPLLVARHSWIWELAYWPGSPELAFHGRPPRRTKAMSTFPLPFIQKEPWHNRPGGPGVHFGAQRNYTDQKTQQTVVVIHGACDLLAPFNTPIYAIEDG